VLAEEPLALGIGERGVRPATIDSGGQLAEIAEFAARIAAAPLTRGFHGKSLWGWVVHEEWCSELG
jgi:hypothetical protein